MTRLLRTYPAVDTKISGFIWYIIVTGHTDFTVHCLLFTATRIPRSFTVHSHSLHAGQGQVKDMDKDKDCSSILHYSALNCLLHIAHASNTGPYLSCLSSLSMTEKWVLVDFYWEISSRTKPLVSWAEHEVKRPQSVQNTGTCYSNFWILLYYESPRWQIIMMAEPLFHQVSDLSELITKARAGFNVESRAQWYPRLPKIVLGTGRRYYSPWSN